MNTLLTSRISEYVNKNTNQIVKYRVYEVELPGFPVMIQVTPADKTARTLLENYFEGLEKGGK